jgi:predicted ABC-type ATPase
VASVDSTADRARLPDDPAASDRPTLADDRGDIDRHADSTQGDSLRRRLDQLPAGHPSSPYAGDGTLRQPSPRLRELDAAADGEDPEASDSPDSQADSGSESNPDNRPWADAEPAADKIRPLTDAEWADHVSDVRTRLEKAFAEGLATDRQFTIDPAGEIWSDERVALHDLIIDELIERSSSVPSEYKAIIAGGLGGAGKSTVLDDHAKIDRSQYLTINPDKIKEEMASRGLIPHVEGLTPMEASVLVHEETSHIAKQLALRAQSDGKNIIWDITMSSRPSTERRIDELRAAGYERIDGLFVDIPIETSVSRADSRHRVDHERSRTGEDLGGRIVSPDVIRAQADSDWGSQNRRTFEEIKDRFDGWSRYDNSVDDRAPVLVEASTAPDLDDEERP